jgi:Na+:H+ antiporter, NhaA family
VSARRRALVDYVVEQSLALATGSAIALVLANSASAVTYYRLAARLDFIVNDVGMAFFFALAAKEIVEATSPGGALHTWRRAALPAIAAAGGVIAPALIFAAYVNHETQVVLMGGWPVSCATDVAFTYLVAKLIYRDDHPAVSFLLLIAITDDAVVLVLLAVFYPVGELQLLAGSLAMASAIIVAFGLRRAYVTAFWPYVFVGGTLSWIALFYGGLSPVLALVPIMPFLPRAPRDAGLFVDTPDARDTLSRFERAFKYPVHAVLFLFGFVNAGVRIGAIGAGTWAVLIAILAGKPLGIAVSVAVSIAAGLRLPPDLRWNDVIVVGFAAGIGFTVALFFAVAAFPPGPILEQLKLGALASVGSGALALGAAMVLRVGRFRASGSPGRP